MRLALQFRLWAIPASLTLCIAAGCGGGGGAPKNVTAPTPDFSLMASQGNLSLTAGGTSETVTVTAAGLNGFSGSIAVKTSGLPAGASASPATFSLTPGASQKVTLTAASSAGASASTVDFTGTSGALSHAATLALNISVAVNSPGMDATTFHYDLGRTGLNPYETTLTTANVTKAKFGLLRILYTDGPVDAEPLVLSNFSAGGKTRNVLYAVTENDSVYAVDAVTGARIWQVSVLGSGETPSGDFKCGQISPQIGITSTPVIDRTAGPHGTIFLVGMSEDQGGGYHQRLHALDAATGKEMPHSPVEIAATYPGTGANSSNGTVVFDPAQYAERAGLLLLNGEIYLSWTSHCDAGAYTGWLMGYNESSLAQTTVLNLTPNGSDGSIWMAGDGLAADSSGNIYFLDANGTFDAQLNGQGMPIHDDYGNGFIKVSTAGGKLAVADYFEMSGTVSESNNDEDLGSGGDMLLPDIKDDAGNVHHLAVGAGKDSNIYIVNRDNMGKFNPNNDDAIYQELDGALPGGIWAKPAYFNNRVYYAGVNDALKAYPIANAKLADSPSLRSATYFGYPGATPTISANGVDNGIVWAVENVNPAVLHAYDASDLREIYNSNQAGSRDQFGGGNKFIAPQVVNGMVYVGTPNGVAMFGLAQ